MNYEGQNERTILKVQFFNLMPKYQNIHSSTVKHKRETMALNKEFQFVIIIENRAVYLFSTRLVKKGQKK